MRRSERPSPANCQLHGCEADERCVLNSRAVAFVLGLLGATLAVAAAVSSLSLLAVGAAVSSLGAGILAIAGQEPRIDPQKIVLLEAQIDERNQRLELAARELAESQRRIGELDHELSTMSPTTTEPDDDGAALTDADTQLFSEAYFRVALEARIASARRHLRPVAIALIDVSEGLASAGGSDATVPAPPARAAESIRETVRDADTACRMADGTFAIILEDTPENGAVWTVERVRRNLVSRFGSHTMWAGVACYPAHAFSTDELLDQAHDALVSAKEWKQDRIEVAIAE